MSLAVVCQLVDIKPHPNADLLEVITVEYPIEVPYSYRAYLVVGKHYRIGDLGVCLLAAAGAAIIFGRLYGRDRYWQGYEEGVHGRMQAESASIAMGRDASEDWPGSVLRPVEWIAAREREAEELAAKHREHNEVKAH